MITGLFILKDHKKIMAASPVALEKIHVETDVDKDESISSGEENMPPENDQEEID